MDPTMSARCCAVSWLSNDDGGSRMEFVLLAAIVVSLGGLVLLALRRLA